VTAGVRTRKRLVEAAADGAPHAHHVERQCLGILIAGRSGVGNRRVQLGFGLVGLPKLHPELSGKGVDFE